MTFLLESGILGGLAGVLGGAVGLLVIYRMVDGHWFLLELWRERHPKCATPLSAASAHTAAGA